MSPYSTFSILSLLIAVLVQHSIGYNWLWARSDFQVALREGCKSSHYTAYETYDKPIDFQISPLDPLNGPKLNPMNKTAGEQWEFDGISRDTKAGLVIGFYRDPNYAILGTGNFRVSLDVVFENGTVYSQDHHTAHSVIEECENSVIGTWSSPDIRYAFEVSNDYKHAKVEIDTPLLKGSFEIVSTSSARYPDGSLFPQSNSTTSAAPFFHWVEPIPTGTITVDLTIEGTTYAWTGLGGHEHMWTAFSWFTVLEGLSIIRTEIGPYQLVYQHLKSHILTPGVTYASIVLFENAVKVFSTTLNHVSKSKDYVTLSKTYSGKTTGSLADRATGHVLNLVSAKTGKHWHFVFEHSVVFFEFALGEGSGGTGFTAKATGGEIDGVKYDGVALVEQLVFPKDSPFFKSNYVDEL